jgi:hypothetical protein
MQYEFFLCKIIEKQVFINKKYIILIFIKLKFKTQ